MRAARNIAIIALLAFVVAAVPGGGNLASGVSAVLMVAFLGIIGAMGYLLYRQYSFAYMALNQNLRLSLLGALGAIVLMIAGADELFGTGAGTLIFLGVLGLAIFAIARVVAESRSI